MPLNPHLHAVVLDGAWYEQDGELCGQGLSHLKTSEVGRVLESTVMRILRHLQRRGLLRIDEDGADPGVADDPKSNLAASAVSGQTPPAGPQWLSGLAPPDPHPLAYDKPLCASLDGFTLHAATRAGALDLAGARRCCATSCAFGKSYEPTALHHASRCKVANPLNHVYHWVRWYI